MDPVRSGINRLGFKEMGEDEERNVLVGLITTAGLLFVFPRDARNSAI